MDDSKYAVQALIELKDTGMLLAMANSYLCDDVFLEKFSHNIERSVQSLSEDIVALKKEFPGKFEIDVETDTTLEKISETAKSFLEPDMEIKERCVLGDLGRELMTDVKSITDMVNNIRVQVYGRKVVYSRKESMSVVYSRKESMSELVGDLGRSLEDAFFKGLKILACLVLVALLVFLFLFFTMMKEGPLREEIVVSEKILSTQREIISQLDDKMEQVKNKIVSMEKESDLIRGDKIAILDLEMELHKIEEDRSKAETEIATREERIIEDRSKLEEIEGVSFIKRLLRQ